MAQARHKAVHRAAKRRPSTVAKVGALLAAPVPDVELLIGAMANPDSGIKFVLGIAKQAGRRVSEVQSVIFDKLKWTSDAAKGWLRDHGFTGTAKDEGATFWRFRQQSPGKYKEFRTIVPGVRNPWPFSRKSSERRATGYMVLDTNGTPVHTGRNLSKQEALELAKEARSHGERVRLVRYENPEASESISSYQEHLETTTDPEFRAATPGEQAAAMTAMDLCENPHISGWPMFELAFEDETGRQLTGHIFAPTESQAEYRAKRIVAEASLGKGRVISVQRMSAQEEGVVRQGGRRNPAYGQVKGRGWAQEWYETASGDARKRAAQLRKLGYWVGVSKGTPQVTGVGVVTMTLVSIGPGSTGDEYLENVPEPPGGIAHLNPSYKGTLIHKTPFGKWKLQLGGMKHNFKTKKQATAFVDRMERRGELKRNPESAAADLYEEFHGKPPGETLEIVTEKHEHEWLTQLGVLVELKVATLTNLEATIRFDKDAPQLCSSEDGRQLYIEGGDQSIDLKALKMDGAKWRKDSMALGVLVECTYQTEKGFQNFQLTDYYHHLGEETGVQPFLLYDPNNELLSVSGGQYEVKPEGIVN